MLRTWLVFSLISWVYCQTLVRNCGVDINEPTFVDFDSCINPPCEVILGKTAILYMNFTPPMFVDTLRTRVIAELEGITTPYPIPNSDACSTLTNTHCPLEENEPGQYKLELPISDVFPEVSILLKFSLVANGDRNSIAACFTVDAYTVKPLISTVKPKNFFS